MNDVTPWFHPEVKPFRVGIYEVKNRLSPVGPPTRFAYWTGFLWGVSASDMQAAERFGTRHPLPSPHWSAHIWRGLAAEPK